MYLKSRALGMCVCKSGRGMSACALWLGPKSPYVGIIVRACLALKSLYELAELSSATGMDQSVKIDLWQRAELPRDLRFRSKSYIAFLRISTLYAHRANRFFTESYRQSIHLRVEWFTRINRSFVYLLKSVYICVWVKCYLVTYNYHHIFIQFVFLIFLFPVQFN